eukprot:CAMPEP_0114516152 /NCGR_PEP_ID=MMETSP0109-20121206/17171_1 /TAXON_ID=29199 /ORGANISM="Chlorarachnion reptans, Strain CCCM449" /LENGTH=663 /DNA_ID=CAMNT_0001696513 /DNA_START=209 /DNA_END=2197 /DNA_ORIENTATION=+
MPTRPKCFVVDGQVRWEWRSVQIGTGKGRRVRQTVSSSASDATGEGARIRHHMPPPPTPILWRAFDGTINSAIDSAYRSGKDTWTSKVDAAKTVWSFDFAALTATRETREQSFGRRFSLTRPPHIPNNERTSSRMLVKMVCKIRRILIPSFELKNRERSRSSSIASSSARHSKSYQFDSVAKTIAEIPRDLTPICELFISGDLFVTVIRATNLGGKSSTLNGLKGRDSGKHTNVRASIEVLPLELRDFASQPVPIVSYQTPSASTLASELVWNHTMKIPIQPWGDKLLIKIMQRRTLCGCIVLRLQHILPFLNPLISGERSEDEVQGMVFHHTRDQATESSQNTLEVWLDLLKDASGRYREKSFGRAKLAFRFKPKRASSLWKWLDDPDEEEQSSSQTKMLPVVQNDVKRSRRLSLTTPGGAPTGIALAHRRRPRMWLSRRNAYNQSLKEAMRVFGAPLQKGIEVSHSKFPAPCYDCIEFLLDNGLHTPGLFRIAGEKKRIRDIKAAYDGDAAILKEAIKPKEIRGTLPSTIDSGVGFGDYFSGGGPEVMLKFPHDAAALLKLYFRELPQPIIPSDSLEPLLKVIVEYKGHTTIGAKGTQHKRHTRKPSSARLCSAILKFGNYVEKMPVENRLVLHYLMAFLSKVARASAKNHMSEGNLAIVW